ncbi:MAG: hypothetical protein MZU97_02345 [Bacillus subtilis]|nr:hypothetical protein [Bacillus subtilis]
MQWVVAKAYRRAIDACLAGKQIDANELSMELAKRGKQRLYNRIFNRKA